MVFPIISILEKLKFNEILHMLQSKTNNVSLMISSSKVFIQKLQESREEVIFSDIIDRVNKLIDNDIDELMLPRKIKRNNNNQHINIEEFYRRDLFFIKLGDFFPK